MNVVRARRFVTACVLTLAPLALVACTDLPDELLGQGGSGGEGGASSSSTSQATTSGVGGGTTSGAGGEAGQTASFEVSVDTGAVSLELRDSAEVEVTITPNGYVGTVVLGLSGVPDDVEGTLEGGAVELDGTTAVTRVLTLTSASDTVTGAFPLTVSAAAPEGTKSASIGLGVEPVITIYIPADLSTYSGQNTAFGPFPTTITALPNMSAENPITVKFFNQDSVPHEIHASQAVQGFPHGNQSIPPGSFDPVVREVNTPGTYDYYPHDLGNGTSIPGRIVIQ